MYPETRMARNRKSPTFRRLCRETTLMPDDLILPIFIKEDCDGKEPINSMPEVFRYGLTGLEEEFKSLKIPAVLLFFIPSPERKLSKEFDISKMKDFLSKSIDTIKNLNPDTVVIADLCLCPFTSNGHCGVINELNQINNDKTVSLLGEMAVVYAKAGADMIAPSAMMDGQVKIIRRYLDSNGFPETSIMSYSAKFVSSFYGPFRDAAQSAPKFGDRKSHQLPPANRREAVMDALLDEQEGADWLMVKPAMPYLDVLYELSSNTRLPVAAYQVSGEYSMIKYAAAANCIDEKQAVLETLISIKRAGARAIITYFAREAAEWI